MAKRRPTRIEYTKVVHYGSGRRPPVKRWFWQWIGLGVLVVVLLTRAPLLALFIVGGVIYIKRKQNGRHR
jgi:hypothetical protein